VVDDATSLSVEAAVQRTTYYRVGRLRLSVARLVGES
jgi:hypothetical protein